MTRLVLLIGVVLCGLLLPEPAEAARPRARVVRKKTVRKPIKRKKTVRKSNRARRIAPPQPMDRTPPPAADPSTAGGALAEAYSLIGTPYRRGGSSPETGFDCSGFVQYVFRSASGIELPRSAMTQFAVGEVTAREEVTAGDLVFFRSRRGWHVGIYAGDGNFIHSPNSRDRVKVTALTAPYYAKSFLGARRIFPLAPIPQPAVELPAVEPLPSLSSL